MWYSENVIRKFPKGIFLLVLFYVGLLYLIYILYTFIISLFSYYFLCFVYTHMKTLYDVHQLLSLLYKVPTGGFQTANNIRKITFGQVLDISTPKTPDLSHIYMYIKIHKWIYCVPLYTLLLHVYMKIHCEYYYNSCCNSTCVHKYWCVCVCALYIYIKTFPCIKYDESMAAVSGEFTYLFVASL